MNPLVQCSYQHGPVRRAAWFCLYSLLAWACLASTPMQAQPNTLWTRTIPTCTEAVSVAITAEGGYVVAGNTVQGVNRTICLVKMTALGEVVWQKMITNSGATDTFAASMVAAPDGGYVIAGGRNPDSGSTDGYLVKIDEEGGVVWESLLGGDEGDFFEAIARSVDGGYVLAGTTGSFGDSASGTDVYLVKTDGEGMLVWEQTVHNAYIDRGEAVIETSDGDVVAAGWTQDQLLSPYEMQQLLVRMDADGTLQWTHTFLPQGSPGGSGAAYDVASTATGGFLVAGWADNFITPTHGFLVETSADGHFLREEIFRISGLGEEVRFFDTEVQAITPTSDGGYVLGGNITVLWSSPEDDDIGMYVAKLDAEGRLEREGLIPGADLENTRDIVEAPDGGYVLVGTKRERGSGNASMYIAKATLDTDTGLETPIDEYPAPLLLKENYPNPFKNQTIISFELGAPAQVTIKVFDLLGREIQTLLNAYQHAGGGRVMFDAAGSLPNGVYLYRVQAGHFSQTRRMVVIK